MSTVIRHSGDQAKYTFYVPSSQWPASIKNVQDALDKIGPWARTDVGIPVASYTTQGIAAIATESEIDAGTNDNKFVTPKGLAYRMLKPEANYDRLGMTRYATEAETLNEGLENRTIVPKQLHAVLTKRRATQAKAGTIVISTTTQAQTGSDDTTAMTPLKVKQAIQALVPADATATETIRGNTKLATVQETLDGVARVGVAVSPYAFANAKATDTKFGVSRLANAADMKGDNNQFVVTPARFRGQRATTSEVGTTQLTTSFGNGTLALAANAPVVNKGGDNMTGRLKLNGVDYVTRNELVDDSIQVGFICLSGFNTNNNYGGKWTYCDGRTLNRNSNPALFSRIGYTYGGSGDNFNVPDLRHMFVRGAASDRPIGRREDDAMQRITGEFMSFDRGRVMDWVRGAFRYTGRRWNTNLKNGGGDDWGNEIQLDSARQVRTADETRPKNMALWYIIRIA